MKDRLIKALPYALLVLLFVLISYGQTLGMYFWQDDSALIFKLQHQAEAAGSFGVGLWERSPYQYLVVPFVPFFSFFKLEPFWYFLVGLISYCIVSIFVYLFSFELLKEKKTAYFVTLIFAAGYVGSEIMFRVINSWQTNIGLCLSLITMFFYVKYFNSKKIKNYFLALGFFLLTIEAVYIRSHSFIFIIFAIDLLFTLRQINIKKLFYMIARQIPFWFLFYKWYIGSQSIGSNGLSLLLKNITNGKFEVFTSLFATVGNALVPDILIAKTITRFGANSHLFIFMGLSLLSVVFLNNILKSSNKIKLTFLITFFVGYLLNKYYYSLDLHWYRGLPALLSGLIGIWGMVFSFSVTLSLWKNQKQLALGVILGYLILISQTFGYFLQYPDSIFGTTHRYLSNPFVGYCLFYGTIFYLFYRVLKTNKLLSYVPLAALIVVNLYLGFTYQKQIVSNRSIPSRNFYKDLLTFVPQIQKGDLFYFDIARDPYYERQFGDFFSVGSMPETTALAIYYNVDRYDVSMFTDFDEFASNLARPDTNLNRVHTFFYGQGGLKDTTSETLKFLQNGGSWQNLKIDKESMTETNVATETPLVLNLTMKVSPQKAQNFPFSFKKENTSLSATQKVEILKYLLARQNYYRSVKATSLSEWKYSEINYVVDGDAGTSWQSHRTRWDKIKDDNVTVDLGQVKNINKIYWTNNRNTLTPKDYAISVSLNGTDWNLVKKVEGGPERKNAEIVIDRFAPVSARFVKMSITKSLTDDSPSISEFEVVETVYDVDPTLANAFIENPFSKVESVEEWNNLYINLKPIAHSKIKVSTDKNPSGNSIDFPVQIDDLNHTYEIVIPQSGTSLQKMEIMLNFPAEVEVQNAKIRNLSLSEMKAKNLIKYFSVN